MSVLVASPRPVTRWRPSTVVAYVLLIALAVFFLLPMFAIVVTSLRVGRRDVRLKSTTYARSSRSHSRSSRGPAIRSITCR